MSTSNNTNQAKLFSVESENKSTQEIPDWPKRYHANIEQKIERDRSILRTAGSDYDDFIDHLVELIMAVEESDNTNSAVMPKPKSKITATKFRGYETNVLRLKLLIE